LRSGFTASLSIVPITIENEILNGEVIRLDGAVRMAAKQKSIDKPASIYFDGLT